MIVLSCCRSNTHLHTSNQKLLFELHYHYNRGCLEPRLDLIKHPKHVNMNHTLGSRAIHSNPMYIVAGKAAARVSGIPYEKPVDAPPLGPTHTGFSVTEMKKYPKNYALPNTCVIRESKNWGCLNKVIWMISP
ncbi:hypothetical protein EDD21DRAFT_449535 [Dissophora ornata]|nr:hypothetical protein EDD21DRAFT_449535 [Dissophora ornata]